MKKLLKYWRQNKQKILITIGVIVFVWICIQIANEFVKQQKKDINYSNNIQDITKPNESIITDTKLNEEKTEENAQIIKNFVQYCNNNKIEQAYSLLSNDCKAEFNNNVNTFASNYYSKIFETQKTYSLELWIANSNTYTYKILYYQDNLLATGGTSINNNIEDYITIVSQNNENKININGYIYKQIINKSQIVNNVEITINNKKVYKNYEEYNISIKNNTSKTILLSDGENSNDICLLDENDVEYVAFLNDIFIDDLYVKQNQKLDIDVKFNKIYDTYRIIEKIKFNSIILNAQEYMENPENIAKEKVSILINI